MNELNLQNPEFLRCIRDVNLDNNKISIIISFREIIMFLDSYNKIFDNVQIWQTKFFVQVKSFNELDELIRKYPHI
mgnify:CR=1 FL=1|jgi:hypothetical protein